MKSILRLLIIYWLIIKGSVVSAQEVISTSGDDFQKSSGSISFTIGEITILTFIKTNNILTQGFHQTNLIAVAINEIPGRDYDISAYPNPAKDYILLKIPSEKVIGMKYWLYDMNGKVLQNKLIEGSETEISFSDLRPSTYFIKVVKGNIEMKTFKIIKQ